MDWLISGLGALVVLLVLRDVFRTLWFPRGQGTLSTGIMRTTWRLARRRSVPDRVRPLAGPLALVAVIGFWVLLSAVGWSAVYAPHLGDAFLYSGDLSDDARPTWLDAFYVSLVTLATLGFGDVVPRAGWLLVATPVQALLGFALLTAAVTWVLQIYPALSRRRALALHAGAGHRARTEDVDAALPVPPSVVADLASELSSIRVDLTEYVETYYFHDEDHETSLALALCRLGDLAEAAQTSDDATMRWAGATLRHSIDDLAGVLDAQFLHTGGGTREVVDAYVTDHGRERDL